MTMAQKDLVVLVQDLVNKQPNSHIVNNVDYFKNKLTAIFEIDQQLYDAQLANDEVVTYITESYKKYINEIANLIDEYEVRHHDLPEKILVMINDFANQLFKSSDPSIADIEQRKAILQQTQKILYCIECILKLGLIEKYIELLSNYKKALNRLDCQHIKIENISCARYLKGRIKTFKDGYSIINTSFESFFDKDRNGIKYNFKKIVTISKLDEVLQDCKKTLQEIEANDGPYQHALNLCGKPSVRSQIVDVLLNYVVPGVLTIISIILWIDSH